MAGSKCLGPCPMRYSALEIVGEATVFLCTEQVPWRQDTGLMKRLENLSRAAISCSGWSCAFFLVRCQACFKFMDLQITGGTEMGMVDCSEIAARLKFMN